MEFIYEMASKIGYEVHCIRENLIRIVSKDPAPYFEGTVDQVSYYLVRLCRH